MSFIRRLGFWIALVVPGSIVYAFLQGYGVPAWAAKIAVIPLVALIAWRAPR